MNKDDLIDEDLGEDLDIDSSMNESFDRAIEQLDSESDEPIIEQVVDPDSEKEPEVEGENTEAKVEEELQDPEEYLEELKQSGDEKKAAQFGKLVSSNQELKAFKDEAEPKIEQHGVLMNQIMDQAGLSPEVFSEFIGVFEAVKNNQPTPETQQAAQNFVLRMAQSGFLDLNNVNIFQNDPDIAERIQSSELDYETGLELVKSRQFRREQEGAQGQKQQLEQQEQQFNQDKQAAIQDLKQVAQTLSASNADHHQIEDAIKQEYWEWAQSNSPSTWAGEYQRLYNIAANTMRMASSRNKSANTVDTLSPNGRAPTQELPTWDEDNMVDHAMLRMQQDG